MTETDEMNTKETVSAAKQQQKDQNALQVYLNLLVPKCVFSSVLASTPRHLERDKHQV